MHRQFIFYAVVSFGFALTFLVFALVLVLAYGAGPATAVLLFASLPLTFIGTMAGRIAILVKEQDQRMASMERRLNELQLSTAS